ncbi:hypothetical protein X741_14320 [Mesorhizobium sp. LNHC229A00]|nr:hypothetical protein X741_14320 [Mesorhizobium sp. LNHC229A00]
MPLIVLPDISPRIVTGEKGADRTDDALLLTLAIGEIIDVSAPLLVSIRGEDAGRQVRGGACA